MPKKQLKQNRCQCCNKQLTTATHFVFGDDGKKRNIAVVLLDYIGKSLHETDGINYAICDACWTQLIQYNDFKLKCIQANEHCSDEEENGDEAPEEEETDFGEDVQYLESNSHYNEEKCESALDVDEMDVEYLEDDGLFDQEEKVILELHIRTNRSKRTIQCGMCDKSFVDKAILDEHVANKHSARGQSDKPMECPVCQKVYNRASRLKKHITTHEKLQKNNVLVCEPCSLAFGTVEDVDEHCNRWHDDDNINIIQNEIEFVVCCEYCEFAFVDHFKLVKHKEIHLNDDKPFKCGFCMASYETYSKLKTHKNSHISQQSKFPVQRHYMCDVEDCWKRYRHWSDLLNHRKTVHLINPAIYKCNDCEQTFHKSWNFSYHKKTVHSNSKVKCESCDFECKTMYHLKSHQKKMHSPAEVAEERPKVKTKAEVVRAKKTLEIDQYLRKSDTAIVCNICGKQLASRHNARSHIEMIHLKIKHFSCADCGKEFYLKKDYSDHKRLHTAETPYECTICLKKFRTASMLNDHRKSHSNNRPHSCPYCTSTFKRAYVLKNHIKQHIGVRGYPCQMDDCKKEYRTQWELNSHQRLKHHQHTSTISGKKEKSNHDSIVQLKESMPKNALVSTGVLIETDDDGPAPKKKRTNGRKVIYVMPGPTDDSQRMTSDCIFSTILLPDGQETESFVVNEAISDEMECEGDDDHNYLPAAIF